jgi:hypothetical protein
MPAARKPRNFGNKVIKTTTVPHCLTNGCTETNHEGTVFNLIRPALGGDSAFLTTFHDRMSTNAVWSKLGLELRQHFFFVLLAEKFG